MTAKKTEYPHKKTEYPLIVLLVLLAGLLVSAIAQSVQSKVQANSSKLESPWKGNIPMVKHLDTNQLVAKGYQRIVVAGGCFWCMQGPFDVLPGVKMTRAGYAGGVEVNPTYKEVSYGRTSHTEAVEIWYEPKEISYDSLIQVFWRSMDPTDLGGQFADRGKQYRPAIFTMNQEQVKAAEASKKALQKSQRFPRDIVVPIVRYVNFYPAEEYHQFYYLKNPDHYYKYRRGSGREAFLAKYWK